MTLVAVADADPDRIAAFAPPGTRAAADADALFADPEVEAVVIATPPAATAGLVRAALEAGKYVLAEKPIALSVAEAADVRDAPGAAERLQIGLTYRHHPAVDRLRELIAGRRARAAAADPGGDLRRAGPTPRADPRGYARRLRSLERLPPIVSDGVHACDRLNYLLGEAPVEVTGWSLRTDPEFAAANVNGGVLTYADGTIARLEVVWLTPVLPPSQFVVTGPLGRAALDPPTFRLSVELADGTTRDARAARRQDGDLLRAPARGSSTSALAGTPPIPGLDEAIASLELAERIARAAGVARGVRGVIDFHVHQPAANAYGPQEYVAGDGRARRRRLGGLHLRRAASADLRSANDSLAAFVAAAPDRMVAFATVDPRDAGAGAEVERCVRRARHARGQAPPWLQGFSAHEPGLQDSVRGRRPRSGSRSSSTTARRRSRHHCSSATLARRHPRTTRWCSGHGGLHDLWREAIAAVRRRRTFTCACAATPGYAMRAIVARCPLERLLFGTDAGLRPEPLQRYASAPHPPARRARPRRSPARGDPRRQPARLLAA